MDCANLGKMFAPLLLQVGLTNSMLKHPPIDLMLKSEKYFINLVSNRRAPEDTIISPEPRGVLLLLALHMSLRHAGLSRFMIPNCQLMGKVKLNSL
jgi:hypothetical protein